eukprot:PhF_6_TR39618/c0_g1_i1/m.58699/K07944/ARL3; ADP-ribosylation factor-like protein 3
MGLLNMLRKMKKSDTEPRLLILGLDNSGKTSILRNLSDEDPMSTNPTQGFNVKTIARADYKINVWDIGGQKAIRAYWKNYFDETNCLVYVVDSSDKFRMDEAGQELDELLQDEKLAGVSVLVFANKQDLATAQKPQEIGETLNLAGIRDRRWQIQGCSAKTGEGLTEGLEWVMANLKQN